MRKTLRAFLIGTLCAVTATAALAAAAPEPKKEHPGDIALLQENDGWVYRHAISGFRLYVSDRDVGGKSTCLGGCSRAWIPLYVNGAESSNHIGDWTAVNRDDGTRQWAYKGRPAYMLFHDTPERPIGNGVEGNWFLLEP